MATEALADIHRCGYIHGDICPANILIQHCKDGPKVNSCFAKRPSDPKEGN